MSGFYTQKKIIYVLLVLIFSNGYSVTFKVENLKNNSMINYERFIGSKFDDGTGDSFEKLVADFNGDGFDDILSLGGSVPTCPFGCGVPTPDLAYPVKMMLYQDGEYKLHDMGYADYVVGALPFDIDQDGDMDLVMKSGKIALNNGNAYFDQVLVFSTETINGEYFVVDWDQVG
ncbi:MAG: hypothetical protein L3J52_02015 [Proteobacteria bacterium]|nr:hypothetical protein [Pseudomonadota bacterium]